MPSTLHIRLLGDFQLVLGEEPVTSVDTPRLQSLVAFLAVHRDAPQSRRHVAYTFWPESTEKQAFNNLRNLIYVLRRAWPDVDGFLQVDDQTVGWKEGAALVVDVAAFERSIAEGEDGLQGGDERAARAAFERAADLYRGELLPGCYDEWVFPERERLHQQCVQALERLIPLSEATRDVSGALHHARHLVRLDPLREASYRHLMRLHALHRDRAGVVDTYRTCVQVLKDELDVEPEPATQRLYERLMEGGEPASGDPGTQRIPLVGRHEAWGRLQAAWRTARDGTAHLVTVTGEAGVGKTRLAEELAVWIQRQGATTARAECYAAEGRLAYAPVVEWLRADPLRETLSTLDDVWLAEVARLLPELRAGRDGLPAVEPLTEGWRRRRLFEALARSVLAHGKPLLLLVDDLQWCDRDTLEWLRFLLRFAPQARLLVLGTVRIEEVGPLHPLRTLQLDLGRTGQTTDVALSPLDAGETRTLAEHVAGRTLDDAAAHRLFVETEGNPLFVVESVRAGLSEHGAARAPTASGLRPATSPSLPPTVRAVLTRRLAQLPSAAQTVAGLAATIGRVFSFDVLVQASTMDEAVLLEALDALWQHHVVRERDDGAYDFTHDKLREAAYAGVSPPRRRLLHQRVARALEAVHANDLDAVSARLAAHYERAGKVERAVAYYRRAARAAERVHALRDAIGHYERARSLLHTLPASRARDERELALLTSLGLTLRLARGHGAPEVGEVFETARALGERLGDETYRFAVHRALWAFHLIRGALQKARALGEALLEAAIRQDDRAQRLEAGVALGLTQCWHGRPVEAQGHLEESLTLYDPERHADHVRRYGQHPAVSGMSVLALVQWVQGYPDRAVHTLREALARAEEVGHPFSEAYALQHAALVHAGRREAAAAYGRARALGQVAEAYGFAYWIGPASILQGWALAAQQQPERGLDLLRRGLDAHRATGATFQSTLWLGLRADACRRAGAVEEALAHIEAALQQAEATGERIWLAELHRLRGALLREAGDAHRAGESFREALRVAQAQRARSLAVRAAVSLGRLLVKRGDAAEAYRVVTDVTSTFPEQADVPDLRDARALLESARRRR